MFARGKRNLFSWHHQSISFYLYCVRVSFPKAFASFLFFIYLRITIRNGGKRWHLKWAREGIWNFRHFEHFAAKYETECKWVLHMSKRKRTLVVLHDEEKSRNCDSFQEWSTFYSLEFVISFGHKRGTLPRGLFSFSWRCYDNNNGLFKAHNLRFSKLVTLSSNLKKKLLFLGRRPTYIILNRRRNGRSTVAFTTQLFCAHYALFSKSQLPF